MALDNFEWCWRILNLSFVIFKKWTNFECTYNLWMCWVTGDDESRVAPVRAGDTGWRNFAAFGILWSPARGTPTRSRGWRDFFVNTWVCWRDLESMGWYTIRWYVIVMDSEFGYFCCATANLLIPELSKCVASLCHLLRLSAGIDGRTLEGVRGMSWFWSTLSIILRRDTQIFVNLIYLTLRFPLSLCAALELWASGSLSLYFTMFSCIRLHSAQVSIL